MYILTEYITKTYHQIARISIYFTEVRIVILSYNFFHSIFENNILLGIDCHEDGAPSRIVVVGLHLLSSHGVDLLLVLLGVPLDLVGQLGMVQDDLLVPHLLDSIVVVALHGVVVLVDLDAQAATGGEVVWLGKMTKPVMLQTKCYFHIIIISLLFYLIRNYYSDNRQIINHIWF